MALADAIERAVFSPNDVSRVAAQMRRDKVLAVLMDRTLRAEILALIGG